MTDYDKNLQKINREDIKRFISTYIAGKPFVAGMIVNPTMNKNLNASEIFKPGF
jgi:zinc protease